MYKKRLNKKFKGIDKTLADILKSKIKDEEIEKSDEELEEEYEEEIDVNEIEKSEEEYDEEDDEGEVEEDTEDEEIEEVEKSERKDEEETIEKSEDEEIDVPGEDEESGADDDGYMEIDEVASLVLEAIQPRINKKFDELYQDLEALTDLVKKNSQVAQAENTENKEIEKSIKNIERALTKMGLRKSISTSGVGRRFDGEVRELSNAQKATILQKEIELGNKRITVDDVIKAETGSPLSRAAEDIIRRTNY